MDVISTILNLTTVIWYIFYLDKIREFTDKLNNCDLSKRGYVYLIFLKVSHVVFMVDYILRLATAKFPKKYILSFDSLIELSTIVPFLYIGLMACNLDGKEIRFCMMLDTLRTLLCKRFFDQIDNIFVGTSARLTEKREFAELALMIVTSIVFPSAFLTWVETLESYPSLVNDAGTDNSFFLQVYFVLTTMSIVGYGSSLN